MDNFIYKNKILKKNAFANTEQDFLPDFYIKSKSYTKLNNDFSDINSSLDIKSKYFFYFSNAGLWNKNSISNGKSYTLDNKNSISNGKNSIKDSKGCNVNNKIFNSNDNKNYNTNSNINFFSFSAEYNFKIYGVPNFDENNLNFSDFNSNYSTYNSIYNKKNIKKKPLYIFLQTKINTNNIDPNEKNINPIASLGAVIDTNIGNVSFGKMSTLDSKLYIDFCKLNFISSYGILNKLNNFNIIKNDLNIVNYFTYGKINSFDSGNLISANYLSPLIKNSTYFGLSIARNVFKPYSIFYKNIWKNNDKVTFFQGSIRHAKSLSSGQDVKFYSSIDIPTKKKNNYIIEKNNYTVEQNNFVAINSSALYKNRGKNFYIGFSAKKNNYGGEFGFGYEIGPIKIMTKYSFIKSLFRYDDDIYNNFAYYDFVNFKNINIYKNMPVNLHFATSSPLNIYGDIYQFEREKYKFNKRKFSTIGNQISFSASYWGGMNFLQKLYDDKLNYAKKNKKNLRIFVEYIAFSLKNSDYIINNFNLNSKKNIINSNVGNLRKNLNNNSKKIYNGIAIGAEFIF